MGDSVFREFLLNSAKSIGELLIDFNNILKGYCNFNNFNINPLTYIKFKVAAMNSSYVEKQLLI